LNIDLASEVVFFAALQRGGGVKRINKQGQALGRKGEESRRRLLDATLSLIAVESVHKLSASKIARAAGMASQSFYLYFKDIDEVLLILAQEAAEELAEVAAVLRDAAPGTPPEILSRTFIESYTAYWERHRPILNARNYIADSGNIDFLKVRHEATMPIIHAIADRIKAAQPGGRLTKASAQSRAVIIYVSMERMAARSRAVQYNVEDAGNEDLLRAEVDILALLFTPVADRG
jgi:AcrR family transcriptional regulator